MCPPDVSCILAIKRQKIIDTMDTHGINEPISLEEAKAWMRYPDTMPSWLMSAKLDDDLEKLNNNEKKRQRVEERRGEGRQRET